MPVLGVSVPIVLIVISYIYTPVSYTHLDVYKRQAKDSGNWFSTFTIDKGKKDGVDVGMNVLAGSGLVGMMCIRDSLQELSNAASVSVYSALLYIFQ